MKKLSALILILAISFSACYAATTVTKTTTKTTTKPTNNKLIFGSAPNKTAPNKTGPVITKTVVTKETNKRYFYPETTVTIAKRTVKYRPWKWLGSVKVVVNRAVMVAQPDHAAALAVNLKTGGDYEVSRRTDSWFYIKADGKEGWVHKDSVKVTKIEKEIKPSSGENLQEETVNEKGNANEKGK